MYMLVIDVFIRYKCWFNGEDDVISIQVIAYPYVNYM